MTKGNKKSFQIVFVGIFLLMITVPGTLAHREKDRISDSENRYYANFPTVRTQDNGINLEFSRDFDSWISDNVRFRNVFMEINANYQYRLFKRIPKADERADRKGELFYSDDASVREYQHLNLMTDREEAVFVDGLDHIDSILSSKGIKLYYMQCYNNYSIYPERYADSVNQFGELSLARQMDLAARDKSTVTGIPIYEKLMENRDRENLYYIELDPGHWNEAGCFLGYQQMLDTIRSDYGDIGTISEDDYDIGVDDECRCFNGFEYPVKENSKTYSRRVMNAKEHDLSQENPELYQMMSFKEHTHYFTNDHSGNDLKILLVGDSYLRMYIKNQMAENASELLSVDWMNIPKLDQLTDAFKPDIVVIECAELPNALNNVKQYVSEYGED